MQMRRILSLDGGGIRGLVSCHWLDAVQDALVAAGKHRLPAGFDLLAGTSTGALIACGLATGLDPAALAGLYRDRRHEIFPGIAERLWSRAGRLFAHGPSAPKYDGEGLGQVLREVFGDTRMGELGIPVLVTGYDTLARKPVIFKSFHAAHEDLPVWEVCRASASAPTYFPAHAMTIGGQRRSMIDGGVVANNPTACAIAEAVRNNSGIGNSRELVVLSVGTGERNRPIPLRSAQEWGALEWAVPIVDVLFDGNTDSVDYIARQLVGDGYFRMQAELLVGLDDLDDVSATNVSALELLAAEYLARASTKQQVRALVKLL